jgi:hypothetical protein
VHAHRVDVLDRADDDEVVGDVAHHLELEFLPADHRLLDQDLVHRAELDAALGEVAELFDVVGDAAADAAHGERRADDEREAERARQVTASASVRATPLCGTSSPISRIASLNSCRSSATLIAVVEAPISSTLNLSSVPAAARSIARFSAVWPPTVGSSASGRSRSMIAARISGVSGST